MNECEEGRGEKGDWSTRHPPTPWKAEALPDSDFISTTFLHGKGFHNDCSFHSVAVSLVGRLFKREGESSIFMKNCLFFVNIFRYNRDFWFNILTSLAKVSKDMFSPIAKASVHEMREKSVEGRSTLGRDSALKFKGTMFLPPSAHSLGSVASMRSFYVKLKIENPSSMTAKGTRQNHKSRQNVTLNVSKFIFIEHSLYL